MAVSAPVPSIPSGEHVQLSLPHVGLLPATVSGFADGAIALVLAVKDSRVSRLGGSEVAVEYKTGRGIQRFGGTLQLETGRPEHLRVILTGDVERVQRREWARVEAHLPITVKGIDEPLGGETQTLNVSGGGVLIKDKWDLPLGLDVRIELQAEPGKEPIRALGRVVRPAGKDEKGVRIDSISREDGERLVRLVRERELAALRMSRNR
jgi:c-di-GMP-binding flagellar brake protein YcgR